MKLRVVQSLFLSCFFFFNSRSSAIVSTHNQVWTYTLLEGSYLTDDCPICARATILRPLRGTFILVLVEQNPLFTRYELRDISFLAGGQADAQYKLNGHGFYQI